MIVNICNKRRKVWITGVFKKSIMLKMKLIHGFQILNYANMLMPWFFMILKSIKNCKIFRFYGCFGHAVYIKTALKARSIRIIPPDISRYFDGSFLNKLPPQKPKTDIINDIKAISEAENISGV